MPDFFISAFLSIALGGLIGLERERSGQKLLGLRSFAATSFLGTLASTLPDSYLFVLLGFAGILALSLLMYRAKTEHKLVGRGITTVLMLPLTYLFGVMVGAGLFLEAGASAVFVTFLLVEKSYVHRLATTVSKGEIVDLLTFAVLTFIIHPFIPSQPVAAFGTHINLQYMWAIVVLVTAISFLLHVLVKYTKHTGAQYAAFLGGMVASVPTLSLFTDKLKDPGRLLAANSLVSAGTVVGDVVLLGLISLNLLEFTLPLFALMAAGFVATYLQFTPKLDNQDVPLQKKPLSLKFIAKFAIVFFLIALVINHVASTPESLYASSLISGLVSSTSVVATIAYLFLQGQATPQTAATAISLSIIASTASKTLLTTAKFPKEIELWTPVVIAAITSAVGLVLIGAR